MYNTHLVLAQQRGDVALEGRAVPLQARQLPHPLRVPALRRLALHAQRAAQRVRTTAEVLQRGVHRSRGRRGGGGGEGVELGQEGGHLRPRRVPDVL